MKSTLDALDRIQIIEADITTLDVDAIVNAANNSLMGGGGVDGAIHRAAGPDLQEACRTFGGCPTGEAKITLGFELRAKYVIHAVGPVWNNDTQGESELLHSVYRRSMELALDHDIKTIAFPSISTGAYRFPFEKASNIAINVIKNFLLTQTVPEKVMLVAFGERDFRILSAIFESFNSE